MQCKIEFLGLGWINGVFYGEKDDDRRRYCHRYISQIQLLGFKKVFSLHKSYNNLSIFLSWGIIV